MKNLKLILAIAGSLIISLTFLGFGLWTNQTNAEFKTALSQSDGKIPSLSHTPTGALFEGLSLFIIISLLASAIALVIGFVVMLVKASPERREKILKNCVIIGWVVIAIALFPITIYFLPTIIAWQRKHRNLLALFILNLCLGAVFGVGWIVALVWAFLNEPAPVVVQRI